MLSRLVSLSCLVAAVACGSPASRPTTVPTPQASSDLVGGIPTQVGRYRLTAREAIGPVGDSLFRFSDGSKIRLTVFRYAVPPDILANADSGAWTTTEGAKFEEVQPYRVRERQIDEYKLAFADTSRQNVGDTSVTEHATAIAVKSRGEVLMDFQYLYLIRGRFLKVRATVPGNAWSTAGIPDFAREVARRVQAGR
jgi:hypothetical protein